MGTLISFPGLGIEVTINRVAFSIGSLDVYWYGILIGLGALLAMLYACVFKLKYFGLDEDRVIDVIFAGTVFAVIGARLYYIAFSGLPLTDFLSVRDGGLGFYGAVIGAFIAGAITAKIRKVRVLPLLDLASIGFLLGQGIGRWGNFVNQEAFGTNTALPWGMTSRVVENYLSYNQASLAVQGMIVDPLMPIHPTFLYESLWCLLGFIVFNAYIKHRKFDGEILLMYLGWNGIGRSVIEGLRTDSLYIGEFRVSQLLAIFGVILAVLAIISIRVYINRPAESEKFIPYGMTEQCVKDMRELQSAREEELRRRDAKRRGIPYVPPMVAEPEVVARKLVWSAPFVMVRRESAKSENKSESE